MPPCVYGSSRRSYCYKKPPPEDFEECQWITDAENRDGKCCDAYRDDQVKVAGRWADECLTSSEALCCKRRKLDKRDEDAPAYDLFRNQ